MAISYKAVVYSLIQDLCYQYWPDSTEQTQSFGTITVEVESIASFANYEIRKLLVQKEVLTCSSSSFQ